MKKAAALYIRSSKDRKDVSPDAQRRALQDMAAARGIPVVTEFVDAVESGKDTDRPAFQAMVAAVRNPNRGWDTVLIHDTSRLSRRRVISLMFEELDCKTHGVTVVYKTLPDVDPLTEIVLKSVLVAWDEYHSISSKQKGLAGMGENVRAGFRAGGRAPAGYRLRKIPTGAVREGEAVTKSVLEPDPDLAPAIGTYLRERAAGIGRLKAKTTSGVKLPDTTLISIEWNALTYAGHTVWNVHAERNGTGYVGGSKRRPRSEWVINQDTHPALISNDEAERILGRLERKAAVRSTTAAAQRDRDSSALLGGLLFAPDGAKWWAETDRYRCHGRSVSRDQVESQVLSQVLADMSSPGFAPALVHATRASLASDTDPATRRKLSAELLATTDKISRMLDMATDLADPAPILRKVDELERDRADMERRLQQLDEQAERAAWVDKVGVDDVARMLAEISAEAKETGRSEVLRPVVASVVERIEIDPHTLDGSICYRIAVPENKNPGSFEPGVKLASPRGFEPRSLP